MGGELKALRYLSLQTNAVSGTLPTQLGLMSDLRIFDAGHDRFQGTVPTELGELAKLRKLLLSDSQLEGRIPSELGRLGVLEELDLYNNALSGDIPASVENLINLRVLFVPNDQLLPVRQYYCRQRIPNVGKYSYRLVREEYHRMVSSLCPDPYDTAEAFSTLSELENAGYPVAG